MVQKKNCYDFKDNKDFSNKRKRAQAIERKG